MTDLTSRRLVVAGFGLGLLTMSTSDSLALEERPERKGSTQMTEKKIRDIFDRYIAALNAHQMDRMTEFVHDKVVQNLKLVSREDVISDLKGHINAVPDFRWRVRDVVVEGDTIAARLFNIGTPAKSWLGIEPTGKTVETLEFAFHKVRDGKFYEMNYAMDVIGLRKRLGLR
ncbi:ester cyclase [Acidovorax sp. Root219]|uniref:ester cyclase n=1 Tax=Acidovorax sp. Root219 TaxID=1736493 RepID=UPI0012FAFE68|nr:ester cyclase [Acidovorax sp. Root219]